VNQSLIFSIGFLAQILFSARQLTQWIASEKAGRILSPLLFWQLSILASFLLMVYGILRNDPVIVLGQILTYGIYIRNLCYHGFWAKVPAVARFLIFVFPGFAICWLLTGETYNISKLFTNREISSTLMIWGIIGQCVFTFRFIYQLLYSEKRKKSLLPIGFWIISIIGSAMLLSYAILRKDPVLFIGQLFGIVVYSRNILLGLRHSWLLHYNSEG
ncbi:MAG: lipid-A-disaccharide synthase N-terminal domain-containing protein, partial [Desulforhopalus sp.]